MVVTASCWLVYEGNTISQTNSEVLYSMQVKEKLIGEDHIRQRQQNSEEDLVEMALLPFKIMKD